VAAVDGGRAGPRHQVHLVLLEQGMHFLLPRTQNTDLCREDGILKAGKTAFGAGSTRQSVGSARHAVRDHCGPSTGIVIVRPDSDRAIWSGYSSKPWHVPDLQSRLAKARNEGSHPDVPHPAQHPVLAACFGIAQSLPTAILVLGSLTVLQNTKINRCAPADVATFLSAANI
jgi:hypothetical protein